MEGHSMTYYCKYCGKSANSVSALTAASCMRHPNGPNKGKHALFEGGEKTQYTCKYCGKTFGSIAILTGAHCMRHPDGPNKGKHSPAL